MICDSLNDEIKFAFFFFIYYNFNLSKPKTVLLWNRTPLSQTWLLLQMLQVYRKIYKYAQAKMTSVRLRAQHSKLSGKEQETQTHEDG